MKRLNVIIFLCILFLTACTSENKYQIQVFETSAAGNQMTEVYGFSKLKGSIPIRLNTEKKLQTITGFGGSFTESSAYLLNKMSEQKRREILEAYFGNSGSKYSLTRTHINSSDFSLGNYSYAPVPRDSTLDHFSIQEDMDDIIPIIKEAMEISEDGFRIISSPWTAPPWMKDNNAWKAGKLLPKYYGTWALFFSKYLDAYKEQGIDIWGLTPENEPLGNGGNWDSMHFTAEEMTNFVSNYLGPQLEKDGKGHVKILGYDQNREELPIWVDAMYETEQSSKYFDGTVCIGIEALLNIFPKNYDMPMKKHLKNT